MLTLKHGKKPLSVTVIGYSSLKTIALKCLRSNCLLSGRRIINTNSTGKDSMVVTHLAQKAGLEFETYFNVTTLDVGESNRMAKAKRL